MFLILLEQIYAFILRETLIIIVITHFFNTYIFRQIIKSSQVLSIFDQKGVM
jgi:hypothetical protein